MPQVTDQATIGGSDYNQTSFAGGMNLLIDDSRLPPNQYRIAFNARNRYDRMDLVLKSSIDGNAPRGLMQELVSFGNFLVLFNNGLAYYRLYNEMIWHQIANFSMSASAPRYWVEAIPVATTNYLRLATTSPTIGPSSTTGFISSGRC